MHCASSSNYPQDFVRNAGRKTSLCSLVGPLPGRADLASAQEQALYLKGCSLAWFKPFVIMASTQFVKLSTSSWPRLALYATLLQALLTAARFTALKMVVDPKILETSGC
jgi:hypothetical protein